jgi:hypothetical protein
MDISDLFPAGPIIDERHQIGRGPSIDALTDRLRAGDVVRVFDRRRWGKSSVARAALARLESEVMVAVRLPLDEYPTASAAAAFLANAFRTPSERAASEARSLGRRLGGALSRAGETVGSEEALAIGGLLEGIKPEDVTLQRVLGAIPAELAKTGRRGAIAIDEAHVVAKWDRDDRASLRAFLARDDRLTGIALASSDSHAERKLKRSNVLGYLGEEFILPAIEIEDWRHGLRSRFDQAEVPIDDEALELLLEESRCHPYCTMLFAKHAAELAQSFGTVTTSVIRLALPTVQKHEAWRLR